MSRFKASGFGGLDLYCFVHEMRLEMSRSRASGSGGLDLYCFVIEMWLECNRFQASEFESKDLHCFVHDMFLEMTRSKPGAWKLWFVLFCSCHVIGNEQIHGQWGWRLESVLFCSWSCIWKWASPQLVDLMACQCIVLFMRCGEKRTVARPVIWKYSSALFYSWCVIGNDKISVTSLGSLDSYCFISVMWLGITRSRAWVVEA